MAGLRASKRVLRKAMHEKLSQLSRDSIKQQSTRASQLLIQSTQYRDAQRIGIYLSMETKEIQTGELVEDALRQGKSVFVPYIHKNTGTEDSEMHMFALRSQSDYYSLQPDKWGIPSLNPMSIPERENCFGGYGIRTDVPQNALLDMIVMPGLAFDSNFGRLGHGKGYYDRFLSQCAKASEASSANMPRLVALALVEQLCDEVPVDANDWPLDALITGSPEVMVRPAGTW